MIGQTRVRLKMMEWITMTMGAEATSHPVRLLPFAARRREGGVGT